MSRVCVVSRIRWSGAILYFSALGLGSFSPPLAKGESLLLVTIWPLCKEKGGRNEAPWLRKIARHNTRNQFYGAVDSKSVVRSAITCKRARCQKQAPRKGFSS